MATSSQECQWRYQQYVLREWWYQQHVYRVMFTNPPRESPYPLQDGMRQAFGGLYQQHAPTPDECIDPVLLELSSQQQPGGGSRPSGFLHHTFDYWQGTGTLTSFENHVPNNAPRVPETIVEIDEDPIGTGQVPVVEETNEQFFNRPEIRELVSIPGTPNIPETTSTPAGTEAMEPEAVPTLPPPASPALPSPLSSPPPTSVPLYTEASGVEVYRVEKIIQAWGPHDARQYLIRWEGWGPESDSWEPAANVSDDLIASFERSRLRRRLSFKRQRRQTRKWG